jgi:hypothetical protein
MKTFITSILFIVMLTSGCGFNGQILRKKSEGLTPAEKDALYQKVKVTGKNGGFYVDGLPLPQDILVKHYEENGADPNRARTSGEIWKLGIGGFLVGASIAAGAFRGVSDLGYLDLANASLLIGTPFLISGLMEWDWSNYAETFNSFACEQIGAEHCDNLSEAK